jgi:hypothetical protein
MILQRDRAHIDGGHERPGGDLQSVTNDEFTVLSEAERPRGHVCGIADYCEGPSSGHAECACVHPPSLSTRSKDEIGLVEHSAQRKE